MDEMNCVNLWYIWDAFSALEAAEAECGGPLGIDANDEDSVKRAFRLHVLPWVQRLKPESRQALKITMAYFLKQPDFTGDEILANIPDLTMNNPTNIRLLFEWLWQTLFGETAYTAIDTRNCRENNDMMEINEFSAGMSEE
jgi:hypothetical protein